MIIDFHTHIFPDDMADRVIEKLERGARTKKYIRGTKSELLESMKKAGVDFSVVLPVATNFKQPHKLNVSASLINEENSGIISFGAMHPDDPDWKRELDYISGSGIKGIKLHPAYQGTDFDDIKYMRIIERAAQLGLIIMVHSGLDIGIEGPARCTPVQVKHILKSTGTNKLILAHMGGWNMWDRVEEELVGENVYIDTSFAFGKINFNPQFPRTEEELSLGNTEQLLRIIKKHGSDKVLFGTDSPWGGQKETLELLRGGGLTKEELRAIEGENGKRLLEI